MKHYMSKGYLVSFTSPGRHGGYGATTSVIGIFNTEKRAEESKDVFIKDYLKAKKKTDVMDSSKLKFLEVNLKRDIKIVPIKMGEIDEQILSKVYE